ncbi:hypothetical protein [Rhodoplanes roseus]|uniref:Uncharacterized protein n=1 Tax=Rhodoplanes roseus TaxID=29409 RepID=A0A327L4D0_9BRAD|nr:hypothetical protein [Rhodoplanes roseus]RAI45256.1 hypothetical protein CH341_04910 [Rhodoplanes roseus]
MTRTGTILMAGLAATTIGFVPAALAQAPHAAVGMPHAAAHHRAHASAYSRYGYSWRPGYGWYVSYRTRLPTRGGFVAAGGPVPPGAYGPVGYLTPAQDGTIYATDAQRIYAYPTYVYPAAPAAYYGTGSLGLSGCAWTRGGWR